MSNVGSLVVSLEANVAKFQSDMGKAAAIAEARAREIDKSLGIIKTGLGAVGLGFAMGATFDAIKGKIEGAIASAAGLQQLSERTGVAVEALSGLAGVAKLSGTDTEQLATGLQKLSKSMIDAQNGGVKTSASFEAIGISANELKGASPDEIFVKIANRLANYKDGAEKTVIAQNLLGKSGANLLPVMNDLAVAGDLQVKVTKEQAEMAAELEKNQIRLKVSTDAIYKKIAMEVIPVFNAFTKALLESQNANNGVRSEVDKLAKDGSIREWAEDAAKVVGFVIDAFDGVARVIQIAGKGLGATAAAAVAVTSGEFSQARSIFSMFASDADAILNKPLFSDRLKKQLAESRKIPTKNEDRKTIHTSGLGNDNAATGPKDDPAKKLLEGQLKDQEAFIAAEKTQLSTREQYLQQFYSMEYSNASDYYATKQALIQDALKAELAAYDRESASIAIYIAQTDKLTEKQDGRNKLSEVSKKRAAAEIDSNKRLTDSVIEQAKAYREFDLATTAVARQAKLSNEAARFQIDMMGQGTLAVQKSTEAKRIELALEQRLYEMRNKNLPDEQVNKAIADSEAQKLASLALIEEAYNKQRDGAFGASEAVRKYAEEAGNNAAHIESMLTNAFKGAEDALVAFVMTGKLDFKSLANSIISDLVRIQIQQNVTKPLSNWIETLFGAVVGGATGATMPAGSGTAGSSGGLSYGSIDGARASGGPVDASGTYLVGENGPELFTPKSAGTIIPNGGGGSGGFGNGGNVIVNQPMTINAPNATPGTVEQIRAMMPAFLNENKRVVVGLVQQTMATRGGRLTA